MKQNTNCTLCPLHENCHHTCIWGTGDRHAKVMIIGEAPGASEDIMALPFVGMAGRLLDHVIKRLGLERHQFYTTNVFKCRPSENELPDINTCKIWFQQCVLYLAEEIRTVNPNVLLLLGNTPLQLICGLNGITKHEGMVVPEVRWKIPTIAGFHPAYVLRSPSKEVRLAQAIYRACLLGGLIPRMSMFISKGESIYDYEVRS